MNLPGTRMIYSQSHQLASPDCFHNVSLMQATDHSLFGLILNDHTLELLQKDAGSPTLSETGRGAQQMTKLEQISWRRVTTIPQAWNKEHALGLISEVVSSTCFRGRM